MNISSKSKKVGGYSFVRLNLPAGLKRRVATVVRGTGKTWHAFMLEAIEEETRIAEKRKRG